jgi:predicted transcriptional regulator
MDRLKKLAEATERSKAFLAEKAIEEFLEVQEWQVAAIREAVAEADGPGAVFYSTEEVKARLALKAKKEKRRRAG